MEDKVTPNKSLGQHWLHDDTSLGAMCDAVDVVPGDAVLEVGPGLGTLTTKLLDAGALVTAVEFDAALAEDLPRRIPSPNLTVVQQDILNFDLTTLPAGYKIAANIPYYLTSKLLRILCESANPFSQAALLMQKEVAERVCAAPGDMNLLSVSVQFYCEASLGMVVPAELFTPPPKVDSQILVLRFRGHPLFEDVDTKQFFRIIKAGFSQRRKTLLNALSAGLHLSKEDTKNLLVAAGITPSSRAQTLSLDDWYHLYKQFGH